MASRYGCKFCGQAHFTKDVYELTRYSTGNTVWMCRWCLDSMRDAIGYMDAHVALLDFDPDKYGGDESKLLKAMDRLMKKEKKFLDKFRKRRKVPA